MSSITESEFCSAAFVFLDLCADVDTHPMVQIRGYFFFPVASKDVPQNAEHLHIVNLCLSADLLRWECRAFCGINGAKSEKDRVHRGQDLTGWTLDHALCRTSKG